MITGDANFFSQFGRNGLSMHCPGVGAPGAAPANHHVMVSAAGKCHECLNDDMDYCISNNECVPAGVQGCPLGPQDHVTSDPDFQAAGGSCPEAMTSAAASPGAAPPDGPIKNTPGGPVDWDRDPDVQVFVTFTPGRKVGKGRSTMVEISLLDTPGNNNHDVNAVEPFLVWCGHSGAFVHTLTHSLMAITDIVPSIRKVSVIDHLVEQWNIQKCEKHLRSVVTEFSHHYTRRQVPVALYNECTNFMTKMSFSHDYVLDPVDTKRCRQATRKFAEHWNHGENAEEKDFEQMCSHACEAKYGRKAPTCNISAYIPIL